ncbi:MAG: recombinase family protein [Clostridia bacterium]
MARLSKREAAIKKIKIDSSSAKYQVGIYVRLSVEDLRKKESQSIETQKDIALNYLENMPDAKLYKIYQDVNFSGTNFKRPDFEQMIEDVKKQRINCIIVKDLSRFGRNYIETGQYMEYLFPFFKVRFIAITDNYDSQNPNTSNSLVLPIRNLMNEVYAKDISKKIKSQYNIKKERGDFCGSFAPYGYAKQGNSLIIDKNACEVVKQIFEMAINGHGDLYIAKRLNESEYLPPKAYRLSLYNEQEEVNAIWHKSIIRRILTNPLYTGNMVSGRFSRSIISNQNRNIENKIVINKGTHTAIISQEMFDKAQSIREEKRAKYEQNLKNPENFSENIFKGLVYCADCGRIMSRYKANSTTLKYHYLCQNHEIAGDRLCDRKYYPEKNLEKIVADKFKVQLSKQSKIKAFLDKKQKMSATDNRQLFSLQKKLEEKQKLEKDLFEKYNDGYICDEDFVTLKNLFSEQIQDLKAKIEEFLSKNEIENSFSESCWYKILEKYRKDKILTREIVVVLIEKISIGDDVEISFRYIEELENLVKNMEKTRQR